MSVDLRGLRRHRHDPASVSWTVTGTNDAPVVVGAVSGGDRGRPPSARSTRWPTPRDVDDGTTLAVTNVPARLPAGVSYDAASTASRSIRRMRPTSTWRRARPPRVGELRVSDGIATTPASVSWTVTGTNDAPVASGAVTGRRPRTAGIDAATSLANAIGRR